MKKLILLIGLIVPGMVCAHPEYWLKEVEAAGEVLVLDTVTSC
jgi:hypothetical protein